MSFSAGNSHHFDAWATIVRMQEQEPVTLASVVAKVGELRAYDKWVDLGTDDYGGTNAAQGDVGSKWCGACSSWVGASHAHQEPKPPEPKAAHCYYCPSVDVAYRGGVPTCGACFARHRRQDG